MTETPRTQTPSGVDTTVAHSARVWNYWLGGKDNYPVDREVGDYVLQAYPEMVSAARADRQFLIRAVTYLAGERGVRQFLDVGTGLPTHNNTHEVAHAAAPEARVVYVDNDPMVLTHARALLTGEGLSAVHYVDADLHRPADVLSAAREHLDFSEPIALTVLGTMGHTADNEEAYAAVRTYVDALPSGSFLALVRRDEHQRADGRGRPPLERHRRHPLPPAHAHRDRGLLRRARPGGPRSRLRAVLAAGSR